MLPTFDEIYARVDKGSRRSLQSFRRDHSLKRLQVGNTAWQYVTVGQGEQAILFLHGMAGAYDIWWQQITDLWTDYRVLSVTYPISDGLEDLERGILALLDHEGVSQISLVGSSLGGYLAQYLVARYPGRVETAILANTFPPNDLIASKNRVTARLLPFLPEGLVRRILRQNVEKSIYPASGYSELVRAYLLEQYSRPGCKARFLFGYRCVTTPFDAPDLEAAQVPALVLEADNDPLVGKSLREMLKGTYPTARVHAFHQAGHFPYLNEPDAYTKIIEGFLDVGGTSG